MLTGKTESGFEFEIDETKADDIRFLRVLRKADENPLYIDEVAVKLLGEDQAERLYSHLEEKAGNVPLKKVAEEIVEIMNTAGEETKNSESSPA